MVQAILEERKTQTRRTRGFDKFCANVPEGFAIDYFVEELPGEWLAISYQEGGEFPSFFNPWIKCPYGKVGDRLWVRETFFEVYNDRFLPTGKYCYAATHQGYVNVLDEDGGIKINKDGSDASPWKPSIHMPRKASRILLEITGIRVERLQDISEDDAVAEGVLFNEDYELWWDYLREQWICVDSIDSYESLICKINGRDTWERNPWVWVIEYKVLEVKGVAMKLTPEQEAFYQYGEAVASLSFARDFLKLTPSDLKKYEDLVSRKRAVCRAWVPMEKRYCGNCEHFGMGTQAYPCRICRPLVYQSLWDPERRGNDEIPL